MPDLNRQAPKAVPEGLEMLANEQGRRRDHRNLEPAHHRDECRPERHLRFAETHIAANQPVHRTAGRHVFQHILDGFQLVVRFREGETRREFVVKPGGRQQRFPRPEHAFRRDPDQLFRKLANALLHPGLARLPLDAAQPVQRHRTVGRAVA